MMLSLITQVWTIISLSNFVWLSLIIKSKRFAFNRIRLFYFKEKPTTPLRHGGKSMKKHVPVKKVIYKDIYV